MSRPITWQTIQGPDPAAALRPMESAQRSFSNMFSGLESALKERDAVDTANREAQGKKKTQSAIDALYAYQTPEAFEAANKDGTIDKMLTTFGKGIDKAQIRAIRDTRGSQLQEKAKSGWAYGNAALDEKEAPMIDGISGMLAKGDADSVAQATAAIGQLSNRGQAKMYPRLDARSQELLKRKWDLDDRNFSETERGWRKEDRDYLIKTTRPQQEEQARATLAATRASTRNSTLSGDRAAIEITEAQRTIAAREAEARKAGKLEGNRYKDGVYDASKLPEFLKNLEAAGVGAPGADGAEVRTRIAAEVKKINDQGGYPISAMTKDGKVFEGRVPLSMTHLFEVAMGADKPWFDIGDQNRQAEMFLESLNTSFKNSPVKDQRGRPVAGARNALLDDYLQYKAVQQESEENFRASMAASGKRR